MTEEKPTEAFTQAYRSNLARLRKIAQRRQVRFNTNWARVKKVVGLMTKNWLGQGYYACPCKQQNDPPIRGVDVACPCAELGKELRRDGHCHCRLFYVP
jgi:ferredoxin-thioredoxin reductase catalytic subunit